MKKREQETQQMESMQEILLCDQDDKEGTGDDKEGIIRGDSLCHVERSETSRPI